MKSSFRTRSLSKEKCIISCKLFGCDKYSYVYQGKCILYIFSSKLYCKSNVPYVMYLCTLYVLK